MKDKNGAGQFTGRKYDVKAVPGKKSWSYQAFGWKRSKEPVPENMSIKCKKDEPILLKRKFAFGANRELGRLQLEYEKLDKKKYNAKPILGIITFILLIVFLAIALVGLYEGISAINTEEPTGVIAKVDGILDKVLDKVSFIGEKVVPALDKLVASVNQAWLNGFTVIGVIGLVLMVVVLIIFINICQQPKKRKIKEAKVEAIIKNAEYIVANMKKRDPSLMGKAQRKQYMWQTLIENAIRNTQTGSVLEEEEDDIDD